MRVEILVRVHRFQFAGGQTGPYISERYFHSYVFFIGKSTNSAMGKKETRVGELGSSTGQY